MPERPIRESVPGSFKFRRNDSVGAAGAEEDSSFLERCFVDLGDIAHLRDTDDHRQIVVGRTGSGKSALLLQLARELDQRVVVLDPAALALTYVSNSTVLRFFADVGVNLEPFFKLLWRHILTVAVLERHFESVNERPKDKWARLRETMTGPSKEDIAAREAVKYLESWGKTFWVETACRVREVTTKLENDLTTAADLKLPPGGIQVGAASKLTEEQRSELQQLGQSVVSQSQVSELTKVITMLDRVLGRSNKRYYILVDRLDEDWIEDSLRYRLIMALIVTARDVLKVRNAKVVIAMRRDLLDRVFRLGRDSGFQQEKYESLYLRMSWSASDLLNLLDLRINELVRRTYSSAAVSYKEFLPRTYQGEDIASFIVRRATRPRDIIDLFNRCIGTAEGLRRLSAKHLKIAEGEYSRSRFRALGDEWSADDAHLLDFARVLRGRPESFKIGAIPENELADLCASLVAEHPQDSGLIHSAARRYVDCDLDASDFRRLMFQTFYKVGLVGLKVDGHDAEVWADGGVRSVSTGAISDDTSAVVHPMYHRALGILSKRRAE